MAQFRTGKTGVAGAAMPGFSAAGAVWRPALAWPGFGPWIRDCVRLEVEKRRLFPWLAVAYGLGIALAFAADGPLALWPPAAAGGTFALAAVLLRGRLGLLALMLACTALFSGFAITVVRVSAVAAPVLPAITLMKIGGFVETLEERRAGGRLVIRLVQGDKLGPETRPLRIRVTARALGGLAPGDYVTAAVRLLPPPEAARPGGYDFARDAYFRGIGAVGSVSGKLTQTEPPPVERDVPLRLAAWVDRARNALTSRIAGTIGGQAGAVAAALITGKRGLIDDHSNDILRAAGIYHIVSISGLHMVLAAGVFFWITRALLALSPALALHWPIKKIAACAGMLGATAYDIFSGSDVATERSLCMILVMQGAILFDRPALSLRNLALSALIVLTREPETLLGPSLQMSYAAVAGLTAMAEWQRGHSRPREDGRLSRLLFWVAAAIIGTVATTIVATIATGPFSSYHFQNLQPYGILGNAVTLPLVSFVVMPAAVLGVLTFPFGLDRPVWIVMGWAVDAVLALSEWVSGIAGSIVVVPAFGLGALGLFVLAILAATLFVSRLRWVALAPAALGLCFAVSTPRQDIYVARDGAAAAIRGRDGRLVIVGRAPAFIAEQWLKADGDRRKPDDASLRKGVRCDAIGCVVEMQQGRAVSFLGDRRGFDADCRRAYIVLSRLSAPPGCGAALVIDRTFLGEHGATAIRDGPVKPTLETARTPGDTRPWLARAGPRVATPGPAPSSPAQAAQPSRPPITSVPAPPEPEAPDEPADETPDP